MADEQVDEINQFLTAKSKEKSDELNSEEIELKDKLYALVEQLKSENEVAQIEAMQKLKNYRKSETSTSVMSLPNFLRFLHPKVDELKDIFRGLSEKSTIKSDVSNLISFLSMTDADPLECLRWKVWGDLSDIGEWGLEHVRHLSNGVLVDFNKKCSSPHYVGIIKTQMLDISRAIATFYFENNCEIEAIDFHLDFDRYDMLEPFITSENVYRICNYLQKTAKYSLKCDYLDILRFISSIYNKFNLPFNNFLITCYLMDVEGFHDILLKIVDCPAKFEMDPKTAPIIQRQMCYIVANLNLYYSFSDYNEQETGCDTAELTAFIRNADLLVAHKDVAAELDLMKPYTPEDIYRVAGTKYSAYFSASYVNDPVRLNLASAFVSGLSNAAFKKDTMLYTDNGERWILSHKELPLMNVVACLGYLFMWDIDELLLVVDKYLESSNRFLKGGAILAIGIASCNAYDPFGSNFAILYENIYQTKDILFRRNAIMAMGLAYAGTDSSDALCVLKDVFTSEETDFITRALSALSIGLNCCATNMATSLPSIFIDGLISLEKDLKVTDFYTRLIPLAIGLCYACRYEQMPLEIKHLVGYPGAYGAWIKIMFKITQNVATGNVFAIQKLLEYIELDRAPGKPIFERKPPNCRFNFNPDFNGNPKNVQLYIYDDDHRPPPQEHAEQPKVSETPSKVVIEEIDLLNGNTADPKSPEDSLEAEVNMDTPEEKTIMKRIADNLKKVHETVKAPPPKDYKRTKEEEQEADLIQGLATIGVAVMSMGQDLFKKMAVRLYLGFLQYATLPVKRAVPIGLGILYASNPQINIVEILSKLSHDNDPTVAHNAIIALGIVGAGTTNSRILSLLRNLNIYYYRDTHHIVAVRLAQGLLYLSKGLIFMSPGRNENTFMSPPVVSALLIHAVCSLDVRTCYLSTDPHMFFLLTPAMTFRGLVTYDEQMNMIPVTVRVGQAVDDIGHGGQAKRITGFQTHRTPVLLNAADRVEIATDKYTSYSSVMEGIVMVKENKKEL